MANFICNGKEVSINTALKTITVNGEDIREEIVYPKAWTMLDVLILKSGQDYVAHSDFFMDASELSRGKACINAAVGFELVKNVRGKGYYLVIDNRRPIADIISSKSGNILMLHRYKMEGNPLMSLSQRFKDATRVILINYAGSGFLASNKIAESYDDTMSAQFLNHLSIGRLKADLILLRPRSYAESDAIKYKMNPERLVVEKKEDIIPQNFKEIFDFKSKNPKSNISVYMTDVALPYALQLVEFENEERNYIKVDLYSPYTKDSNRPCFIIPYNNKDTSDLYTHFYNVIFDIYNDSEKVVNYEKIRQLVAE